ncbi:hypothetical protein SERLA73DRAFT_182078 [Serpula lacrymans var. lacrymans S7.3]|uniref:Uncharacterized protein n=2 Tax=Serpula lacrymans var. lacrymans TaxID=341189 RepID=F8PZ86_SERL3|nr:uncharacterized protein SERLADRAFT_468562 [Serpula lacrymans var. lacrymans S7.9]EGN99199.1 hypothetical protein SERLA73DRAFT_182078 [Serpula lacrymans var. lacrymans S7.3]EGO24767.1 hypothetical protein SERLADRAFT_468562 [Serpula lacrymans var. lacrymans S7.9]
MGMRHGTNEKLYHGVWAGDRFTTIDKLDQHEGEKEWEDVSEEVMEDMVEIWKMEHVDGRFVNGCTLELIFDCSAIHVAGPHFLLHH